MRRAGVLLGTVLVALCMLAPSVANAYTSGVFSTALATPDWTHGSFAATVNASPCGIGYCSYFAVVFAQPSLPEYGCRSEEFADDDRNTEEIWKGPTETSNATFEAAASGVSILHGVYGQRYCLELIGEREQKAVICEALEEHPCPPIKVLFGEYAAGALMTVEIPAATTPAAAAPAICSQGEAAVAKTWREVTKARQAIRHAKSRRTKRLKRQIWERDKKEARQTEQQQHELCG